MKCVICYEQFPTLKVMQRHLRKYHDVTSMHKFSCQEENCGRSYTKLDTLFKHIRNSHSNPESIHYAVVPENRDSPEKQTEAMCDKVPPDDTICVEKDEYDFDIKELAYILKLFHINNINRKNVYKIIEANIELAEAKKNSRPFKNLETEYDIIKALRKLNLWVDPVDVTISYRESVKKNIGENQTISSKPATISIIKLTDTFKRIFNSKSTLDRAMDYMSKISEKLICDVKDVQNFPENTFPFVMYFDEIECGNPLGSHKGKNKLGMFYISLRCFDPCDYSKLENIYLYTCVPADLMSKMDSILKYLVEEINSLYIDGLNVNGINLKFKMIGLVGDNLGQHQILGFVQSFRANFYCIRCKVHRKKCEQMCILDKSLLRTESNYLIDLDVSDVSITGINRKCVFNDIVGFNVTRDICFDIMHDLLEGTLNIVMSIVILNICEIPDINLDLINNRIALFDFGSHSNRPIRITKEKLEKKTFRNECS